MPSGNLVKWSTYLNQEENDNAERLLEYLWKCRVLDRKTPYSLVKYLVALGVNMMDKEIAEADTKQEEVLEEVP